jgi:hypothetical protein
LRSWMPEVSEAAPSWSSLLRVPSQMCGDTAKWKRQYAGLIKTTPQI